MITRKKKRSKTSGQWLNEHVHDPFTRRARQDGYRARSAYKLLELNDRENLLKPGMTVVDLGSAPGSWSQVAAAKTGPGGRVIAVDILPMRELAGVEFVQGDFTDAAIAEELRNLLGKDTVNLVISDIAPNISGIAVIDQQRSFDLITAALDFAVSCLSSDGVFLVKAFQGSECSNYIRLVNSKFKKVAVKKPAASRDRSTELYILAKNLR